MQVCKSVQLHYTYICSKPSKKEECVCEEQALQTAETIEPVHNFISVYLKEQHKVNLYSRDVEAMK